MTDMNTSSTEVIATYAGTDGATFEIDHLGICHPRQWGEFAVYRAGVQVAEFSTEAALYGEGHRPSLPDIADLIVMAKQAVTEDITAEAW